MRFCRSIGFSGYREFKGELAKSLVRGVPFVNQQVEACDDARTYVKKIGDAALDQLSKLIGKLNIESIEKAVNLLSSARRVEFWGFAASAAVAIDAQQKFFRLGIPCNAYSDPHMQCMSASILSPDDVIVIVSHTGRTKELLENAKIALDSGTNVIALTATNSPLSVICTLFVPVDIDEDTDVFPPMVSRLGHLLALDIIVIGVALRRGQQTSERQKRIKKALSCKRITIEGDADAENS